MNENYNHEEDEEESDTKYLVRDKNYGFCIAIGESGDMVFEAFPNAIHYLDTITEFPTVGDSFIRSSNSGQFGENYDLIFFKVPTGDTIHLWNNDPEEIQKYGLGHWLYTANETPI